ncbi:MAG: murein transglycosylase A [Hyphomicrobiaceae bacterium]
MQFRVVHRCSPDWKALTALALLVPGLAAVRPAAVVAQPTAADVTAPSAPTTSAPAAQPKPAAPAPVVLPKAAPTMTDSAARFVAVLFADLPGWADDDHLAAFKAFLTSCPRVQALAKLPAKANRASVPPSLVASCDAALALPAKLTKVQARDFFEHHFQPRRVIHATAHGLLTGYYEPLLEGSRKREGRFQTPIYRRPSDLVNVVDETQRGAVGTAFTHMRQTQAGLVPFASRAEIDAGALKEQNLELLFLADPVDVFFLQVQGSGRVKLPDGTIVRVHYDGKNGHPYTSIGRYLIDKGLFAADKMSLGALGRWLRSDPGRAQKVMQQNASYVFFRELANDAAAPLGAMLAPLTSGRSLAVDPRFHALGSPVYVSAPTLTHALKGKPFQRLMVAHDVGSAIKGPERGDIYFGSGETAGRIAGVTKHPGHFFVLEARQSPVPAAAPAPTTAAKQAKP